MNTPFHKSSLMIALFLAFSSNAIAIDIDTELTKVANDKIVSTDLGRIDRNSKLYYKLGGSRPLSPPPSHNADLKVGGKLKFGAGYSCGKFDPSSGLQNFMNNLKNGVDDAMNTVSQAGSSAIAGLPALILSRNSPDLYELLQTNVFRAEEKLKFNAMSCQAIERQLAAGENPYKQWTELAQGTALNEKSESNPDVNTAMQEVKEEGGDNGVYMPVPGKGVIKAGGKNQDPIRIVSTATVSGYNVILKRDTTILNEPTKDHERRTKLVSNFKNPEELRKWAVEFLGEQEIYTTKTPSKEPESKSGIGLSGMAIQILPIVKTKLTEAYNAKEDEERITLLSEIPGNSIVTSDLIQKIRASGMNINMIDALADELSLGLTIDKGLLLRRVLITSLSEKNISASQVAKVAIQEKIKLLESELNQAVFEYDIRKKLVTNLANTVYELDSGQTDSPVPVRKKASALPKFN
ncbi:integrating conjugative element protein [Hydrogenovibrio sp. SC-1]|uniref:integrating conjugative element protein n=1 Tax=Hydrogenovibrio sp. SC-1 TaxID=2065820 RepID=UPI000C798459|nr:integrating conjugative element protein [Hydrogenovibrio sp. SC-1]PLA73969.1 integrating conjugative element protein [Hydrogenovibrio sp. SC-1]